jgi:hypothetical protein
MNKKLKPSFGSHAQQRSFWAVHVDWSKAKRVGLPDLKMSRIVIASRPPQGLLDRGKVAAGKRDAPCQSLIRVRLAERGDAE